MSLPIENTSQTRWIKGLLVSWISLNGIDICLSKDWIL